LRRPTASHVRASEFCESAPGTTGWSIVGCDVRHLYDRQAPGELVHGASRRDVKRMSQIIRERRRDTSRCDRAKAFPVGGDKNSEGCFAQPKRLIEHRVEDRREVAGRGIDDLQHLGGRGLLLRRLARLGQQPCILHGDDRLRCEILKQGDFLFGERPDLCAMRGYVTEQRTVFT